MYADGNRPQYCERPGNLFIHEHAQVIEFNYLEGLMFATGIRVLWEIISS